MKDTTSFVAYYRVSTKRQGMTRLGLDAQKAMVQRFIRPGQQIITEYIEIESGKVDKRPKLQQAIDECSLNGSTLLIAKLDRLSRNAQFILKLRDSKVPFIAVDMPDANNLTIGLLAVVAQHEREMISDRTKRALQVKKQQGYRLGTPENLTDHSREIASKVRTENALNNPQNQLASELIYLYKSTGLNYLQIANKLNKKGIKTRSDKSFHATSVKRLFIRYNYQVNSEES
jgi:DNA invertase Pin-like site-specific DNA recombinase